MTLYEAESHGQAGVLSELTLRYTDLVCRQLQLQEEVPDRLVYYWRQKLSKGPKPLELPADFPRPAQQSYGNASLSTHLLAGLPSDYCQYFFVHQLAATLTWLERSVFLGRYFG